MPTEPTQESVRRASGGNPGFATTGYDDRGDYLQLTPRRLFRITFFGSLLAFVGALVPLELWARGTINSHKLAVTASLAVGITAPVWLIYRQLSVSGWL